MHVQPKNSEKAFPIPAWLLVTALGCSFAMTYAIFMWVSTETTMGVIQRAFYFHVPAAIAAFVAVFVGGVASILYLYTQKAAYDDLAAAANYAVIAFSSINIVVGSIWGRRVWGIWWTWDARLTSSLLLVIIYFGYIIARQAIPVERRAGISAVLCLFGMADVPLIYMSNRIFRTQHPSPVFAGGENSGIAPDMVATFVVASIAMLLFLWCVVLAKRSLESLHRQLDTLVRTAYVVAERRQLSGR